MCNLMSVIFFFNDTATTEIYTLSLHDALPIYRTRSIVMSTLALLPFIAVCVYFLITIGNNLDRKSTRLNSSHANISYAVFCLKKKKHHYTTLISIIIRT